VIAHASAELHARLDEDRRLIDAALADVAASITGDDAVSQAMRYAITAGGKRLRPILCLAAVDAVGAPRTDVHVRAAACIELVHTYSLVHDDLPCMDDDSLRRGRPTAHVVYGTATASLAGLALIPLACERLARCGEDATAGAALVAELCAGAGAGGMVGGQVLDLEAEGAPLTLPGLRRIHDLKTGALFRASLRIGGRLAGATVDQLHALGEYGAALGLAFQIADDILDVTMDAAALGKTPGKDVAAGKGTFVSLLGLEGARAAARAEADRATEALRNKELSVTILHHLLGFAVHRDR